MQFRYECVSAASHRKTPVHTKVNWGTTTLTTPSHYQINAIGVVWKVPAHFCLRPSVQDSGPSRTHFLSSWVHAGCRFRMLPWCSLTCRSTAACKVGLSLSPSSLSLSLSLSLSPSYLLSSIIDCSHCTNFICWLWIMNETRSGGAFSSPLVWYPISHLQCIWAIRDQARGSQTSEVQLTRTLPLP